MAEPFTITTGLLTVAAHVAYHLIGGEAHHSFRTFVERWREAAIDPNTGLPRNHDLQKASLAALRGAAQVLVMELARCLEPAKPWLPRIVEHVRAGRLFKVPLFESTHDPHRQWTNAMRNAIGRERFGELHDQLHLGEEDVGRCITGGNVCAAFAPRMADAFLEWARREVQTGTEPPNFAELLKNGWTLGGSHSNRATLAHAYCLFFLEYLKSTPAVFRILVAGTLTEMRGKLDSLGASLTDDLKALHNQLPSTPAHSPIIDFTTFECWLEPQLGEFKTILADVGVQLKAVAGDQSELYEKQEEILVALVTLNLEVRRGNAAAGAQFEQLRHWLTDKMKAVASGVVRIERNTEKILDRLEGDVSPPVVKATPCANSPPVSSAGQAPRHSRRTLPIAAGIAVVALVVWWSPWRKQTIDAPSVAKSPAPGIAITPTPMYPRVLRDRASRDTPAMAAFNGQLYMAWRGYLEDNIWFSYFTEESHWSGQEKLEDRATMSGPALAAFNGRLYMTWRGLEDNIWFSSFTQGAGWSGQEKLEDRATRHRLALAAFNGRLYLAWRGPADGNIWYSSFAEGSGWSNQQKLQDAVTRDAPTLAAFDGRLYVAWRGLDDKSIWLCSFTESSGWSSQHVLRDRGTRTAPALMASNGQLYMVWRGLGDNNIRCASFFENTGWSPESVLQDPATGDAPALAVFNGRLYMTWRELREGNIWYGSLNDRRSQQAVPAVK